MAKLSLIFDLVAKDRASRELRNVGDAAEKTGGRLGVMGKAVAGLSAGLAAGAAAGFGSFAKGAVDAFAAVEDATGAAGVQFGKQLPSGAGVR